MCANINFYCRTQGSNACRHNGFVEKKILKSHFVNCFRWSLAWAPHDPELEKIMISAFSQTPNLKRKLYVKKFFENEI